MAERDVEVDVSKSEFIKKLRRIADSLEQNEKFRIQIAGKRITIKPSARLSVEHEVDKIEDKYHHEVELQFKWSEEA